MENIENVAKYVLLMDKQLREKLLVKDGKVQNKKLWEYTHIKKQIDRRKNGDTFTVTDHIRAIVYILWSYCANGYGEICSLKNPKCQSCVAKQICKFTE